MSGDNRVWMNCGGWDDSNSLEKGTYATFGHTVGDGFVIY